MESTPDEAITKKAKIEHQDQMEPANQEAHKGHGDAEQSKEPSSMIVQFRDVEGNRAGPNIDIPIDSSTDQLEELLNQILSNQDEKVPYGFYLGDDEVVGSLSEAVATTGKSTEAVLQITYQPLAVFRVRAVTRCTDTMVGHTEAVLHVSFSPDGRRLASGGGDTTVRFWDTNTCMPRRTCRGHKHHVLCTAWSPDGRRFASADRKGEIILWNPDSGEMVGTPLKGHKQWVTYLSWEPLHRNPRAERMASSSKDTTVKIWNTRTGRCELSLSGHTQSVECVKWGGEGLLYSASRDRTIKVWAVEDRGQLVRTLVGHGHRVNTLALSSDYVLRTGPFDHRGTFEGARDAGRGEEKKDDTVEEGKQGGELVGTWSAAAAAAAQERYQAYLSAYAQPERLVSGSDDFTLFLWSPTVQKQPLARLTGHQQAVNHIVFSPDGRRFASASFDKKVKIWCGKTGKFLATLTGHVGAVYQGVWSADSRLFLSASKDSTVKVWDISSPKKAKSTLPGHADEVYALDWSPNGTMAASGSKDRTIKIWRY